MPGSLPPDQLNLTTPLADIQGVRRPFADALAMLGVTNVADLVKHLPMRYDRLEAEASIQEFKPEQFVSARGEITATRVSGFGPKQRFQAVLVDGTGRLDLVWFNAPYMKQKVFPGIRVRVQGKTRQFGPGLQLTNPQLEVLREDGKEPAARDARVRPIYPASEQISSGQIESVVKLVLEPAVKLIEEHLPEPFRRERHMPTLAAAYQMAHAPESVEQSSEAQRRLAYDEFLLLQLGVFLRREQLRTTTRAIALRWSTEIDAHIRARFPFGLTEAQERVIGEIRDDLTREEPANRLLQGDVGAGKTIIALYAMLLAVAGRHQAALMAPTELLAEQHFASISRVLEGSSVRLELLTGSVPQGERQSLLSRLESGDVDIVIGTHALLTDGVRFKSLAVAIIDEQHRFGVHQRAALRSKGGLVAADAAAAPEPQASLLKPPAPMPAAAPPGSNPTGPTPVSRDLPLTPHVIVMTATPIPRTLALTLLGDLDVSTIDQLPPGRTPIATRLVGPQLSGEVYKYVRTRLDAGDQAYIVVPAIDAGASTASEGGDAELNDLRTVHARLEAHELAGKRVAAVHGRLKRETRELMMARFRAGAIDALVATTVIEVGVDVPNATVMVIEHAELFGLAQLHQLRGRIGRGSKKSTCILIADPTTPDAEARLGAIAASTDGFALAETDLQIRGPGEVFGMKQAGAPPFKVADLTRDRELLALARRDAQAWIERSPTLHGPGEDLVRKRLLRMHGKWLGLGDVG